MTKYRVKAGIHFVGKDMVKKGEFFELKNANFVTAANAHCFEKVEPPAPPAENRSEPPAPPAESGSEPPAPPAEKRGPGRPKASK